LVSMAVQCPTHSHVPGTPTPEKDLVLPDEREWPPSLDTPRCPRMKSGSGHPRAGSDCCPPPVFDAGCPPLSDPDEGTCKPRRSVWTDGPLPPNENCWDSVERHIDCAIMLHMEGIDMAPSFQGSEGQFLCGASSTIDDDCTVPCDCWLCGRGGRTSWGGGVAIVPTRPCSGTRCWAAVAYTCPDRSGGRPPTFREVDVVVDKLGCSLRFEADGHLASSDSLSAGDVETVHAWFSRMERAARGEILTFPLSSVLDVDLGAVARDAPVFREMSGRSGRCSSNPSTFAHRGPVAAAVGAAPPSPYLVLLCLREPSRGWDPSDWADSCGKCLLVLSLDNSAAAAELVGAVEAFRRSSAALLTVQRSTPANSGFSQLWLNEVGQVYWVHDLSDGGASQTGSVVDVDAHISEADTAGCPEWLEDLLSVEGALDVI